MKIVVIGGSGLIGSKLVDRLRKRGHEVIAASPSVGINTITGEGLDTALTGARVVVDVANSPSFADGEVLEFFETSGRNLLAAEVKAGVAHHVALSVVGTDRLSESGYFRGKIAQEALIKSSDVPFSIVRSTQFLEFLGGIAHSGTVGKEVHLSPAYIQPITSDDVADALAAVTLGAPLGGTLEIAGPDRYRLTDIVRRFLEATLDERKVVANIHARYFGAELTDDMLLAGANAQLGRTSYTQWMSRQPRREQPTQAKPS